MDETPDFPPIMLRGLPYSAILRQMRVTGCGGRRPHWCVPMIVYDSGELILDNEGRRHSWVPTPSDKRAADWEMVERPK